ncbi:MAG: ABC transporter permease [Clostridiales bacterium]|nr:ABC transporter permease [Clostridiales bacterium]
MYILRNAWLSVSRAVARNVIIGLIMFVLATACCIALSIQQSADVAREDSLQLMDIEAHINVDRQYIMEELQNSDVTDRAAMSEKLEELAGLSLSDMQTYAEADCVQDFYYVSTIYLNGNDDLLPLSDSTSTTISEMSTTMAPPGANGPSGDELLSSLAVQGQFPLEGYVSDRSMSDFYTGVCEIAEGTMFEENTTDYVCIISDDLATYNSLEVGHQITLCNYNNENETFVFTIVGIYNNTSDSTTSTATVYQDPGNVIITSYAVVSDIVARSEEYNDPAEVASFIKDGDKMVEQLLTTQGKLVTPAKEDGSSGEEADDSEEESLAITETIEGTYLFATMDDYDQFETAVREMGLETKYTVTSNDVASYEESLVPLNNLKMFAETFLYVVLAIGSIVLVALNVLNIRERKYEIGVLSAIGMPKRKVAMQFTCELLIVSMIAIMCGLVVGSLVSVPVTNELLAGQVAQSESDLMQKNANYGRQVSDTQVKPRGGDVEGEVDYVTTVQFSIDYMIILKMAAIGLALAILSGSVTSLFIMRYDPLRILSERE